MENSNLISTIYIKPSLDIESSITVKSQGIMFAKFNIIPIEEKDLNSSISISIPNDIITNTRIDSDYVVEHIHWPAVYGNQRKTSIYVLNRDDLESEFYLYSDNVIENNKYGYQKRSSLTIPYLNSINSTIHINPNGNMFAAFDIVEPLKVNLKYQPTKDAFVRKSISTLNYGSIQSMLTGVSGDNDICRSLIQFDISNFPKDVEINKAALKLFNSSYTTNQRVLLYKIANNWDEYGVTWRNQPYIEATPLTFNITSSGFVELDISQFVNDWLAGEPNFGLELRTVDENQKGYFQFAAKESSNYSPQLEIEYTDWLATPSIGRSNIDSNVYILNRKDLLSLINVPIYDIDASIESSIRVKSPDTTLCSIDVSNPIIESHITVQQNKNNDIESNISVRIYLMEDLESTIRTSVPNIKGLMYVRYRNNISSSATVRISDEDNISSKISINRQGLLSQIKVPPYMLLDSSISIRTYKFDDLKSKFAVNRNHINSRILVIPYFDFNCNVTIRQNKDSDINSMLRISKKSMDSVVYVRPYNLLDSSISARRSEELEILSKINISRNWLDSNIFIRPYVDIESDIIIRQTKSNDVIASINVNRIKLYSTISINPYNDIESNISIKQYKTNNINSNIQINRNKINSSMQILHRDDLISNCDIRVSKNDDILFKLAINQTKLFGTLDIIGVDSYDIVGNITVRRNSSNDIDSRVSISRNTLFSSAKINPVSQIECTIEIKRFSDINSKMNILFREDLHCEIDIISINNINSTLYVNSGYLKSSLLIPYYDKDDIESIIKVKAIWIDELESSIFVGIPNGGYVFIY